MHHGCAYFPGQTWRVILTTLKTPGTGTGSFDPVIESKSTKP
jgi:hypothetical protein